MKTVIIPCCGKGRLRGKPIWMNRHPDGKFLIEKCIDGIKKTDVGRIIVTVLEEDVLKYGGRNILEKIESDSIVEIFIIKNKTWNQAETVYRTIKENCVEDQIIIKDSDVDFLIPDLNHRNFVLGANLMKLEQPIVDLKSKSFCLVNEQNIILDITEKRIKTENICVGLYGLKNAADYTQAYEKLIDADYGSNSLYVSSIIAYLIGMKKNIFHYFEVGAFEPWDNDTIWQQIHAKRGCYFILCDGELGEEFINELQKRKKDGAKLFFVFSEDESKCEEKKELLRVNGIDSKQMLFGCGYGEKAII